jgi:hypothetical protein
MIDFPTVVYLTQADDVLQVHTAVPERALCADGLGVYALHQVKRMKPEAAVDLKDETQVAALRVDLAAHVTTLRALAEGGDKRALATALDELATLLPNDTGEVVVARGRRGGSRMIRPRRGAH